MKNHIVMYIFLAIMGVLILSRGAAASGAMLAGGSVLEQETQTLTGQFAQKGGQQGSFSFNAPGGRSSFSLG